MTDAFGDAMIGGEFPQLRRRGSARGVQEAGVVRGVGAGGIPDALDFDTAFDGSNAKHTAFFVVVGREFSSVGGGRMCCRWRRRCLFRVGGVVGGGFGKGF